jgi:hypothetical protein
MLLTGLLVLLLLLLVLLLLVLLTLSPGAPLVAVHPASQLLLPVWRPKLQQSGTTTSLSSYNYRQT